MNGSRRFLERVGFHLPFLHDWLAERDDLRRETHELRGEIQSLGGELQAVSSKLDEFLRACWKPPGHFYSPLPAISYLQENREAVFSFPPAIRGVDLREKAQLDLLDSFRPWYDEQPFTDHKIPGRRYFFDNPNYSYADALVLYCMMRHLKPRRIVEVGSGYSSCAILDVNDVFFDNGIACTFIDPYPELLEGLLTDSDRSRVRILGKSIQDVDIRVFQELEPGDILFIDSSHVTKTGSDLNYLMFKILPLLEAGVHVHFHDIFYPFEYPEGWVHEGRGWNEAYLLRAFLQYNNAFEIKFFTIYLAHYFRARIEAEFPLFMKCTGGSIWLSKTVQNRHLNRMDPTE